MIDKECLAIVQSLLAFKYVIYGYEIQVLTDHLPLVSFLKSTQLTGKRVRWTLILEDFSATVRYIPGKVNVIADCLSRNSLEIDYSSTKKLDNAIFAIETDDQETVHKPVDEDAPKPGLFWDFSRIRQEQMKEKRLSKIIQKLESQEPVPGYVLKQGVLCRIYH